MGMAEHIPGTLSWSFFLSLKKNKKTKNNFTNESEWLEEQAFTLLMWYAFSMW